MMTAARALGCGWFSRQKARVLERVQDPRTSPDMLSAGLLDLGSLTGKDGKRELEAVVSKAMVRAAVGGGPVQTLWKMTVTGALMSHSGGSWATFSSLERKQGSVTGVESVPSNTSKIENGCGEIAWASSVFRVAANRDRLQDQNWMHVCAQSFLPVPGLSFFFYKTLYHLVHRVVISKGRWVQKWAPAWLTGSMLQ